MANKLKDLQVTKVDFVDAGANPEANIMLFKRAEEEPPAGNEAPAQGGVFHRIMYAVAKAMGASDEQADVAIAKAMDLAVAEEIDKADATTFGQKMVERQLRRTADEIWDYCYALQESLCSILRDNDVNAAEKPALMTQSCNEFVAAVVAAIPKWAAGVPTKVEKSTGEPLTEERLQIAKEARARLDSMIEAAGGTAQQTGTTGTEPGPANDTTTNTTITKGENDIKIDKSKLTPEELTALEAIEKKAGIPDDAQTTAPASGEPAPGAMEKSATTTPAAAGTRPPAGPVSLT